MLAKLHRKQVKNKELTQNLSRSTPLVLPFCSTSDRMPQNKAGRSKPRRYYLVFLVQERRIVMQLAVEHICFVVKDLDEAMERYRAAWGIDFERVFWSDQPTGTFRGKKAHYSGRLAFFRAGPVHYELVQPGEGASIWREALEKNGESFHHVGIFVPDLAAEIAQYAEKGIGVIQTGESERVTFAYMDTQPSTGVLVEILQNK